MNIVRIPKGGGKFRTIYAPNDKEMNELKRLANILKLVALRFDRDGVQHAFHAGRSPVTNAMQHIGFMYTIKFDLKDFFDSVTEMMAYKIRIFQHYNSQVISEDDFFIAHLDLNQDWSPCFIDGAARQGLPTSPFIANIVATPMDREFLALNKRNGRFDNSFIYTRYADDLTFSFNEPRMIGMLRNAVPEIVAKHGFVLNEAKTGVQCAKAGRRMVTGIGVDDKIYIPRKVKRRLRAAKHNGDQPSEIAGLEQWMLLKQPKGYIQPLKPLQSAKNSIIRPVQHQTSLKGRKFSF